MAGRLREEIKQTRPFRSLEEEALLNLWRTADGVNRTFAELVKPYGISEAQYNVLRILRGAGKAGLCCGAIAGRMVAHDPDVTRLLDRLEKRGLAARCREAKDRRMITARITAKGLKLLHALDKPNDDLHRSLLGHLSRAELKTLIELLERARGATKSAATQIRLPAS